jgi:YD repeat-containing protein
MAEAAGSAPARRPAPCVTLAAGLLLALAAPALAQHPIHKQGLGGGQAMDGALPFEQVDPLSGNLVVSATDLVLPGNAGLDLRVQRFYNSAIYPGYATGNLDILEVSWAGLGWRLHFGRVINPYATESGETQIELGDGSTHPLYTTGAFGEGWITRGMALYDRGTHTLKLPNGLRYVFGREAHVNDEIGWVRYVTEIRDPFDNWITFEYFDSNGPVDGVQRVRQFLSPTQIREVTFTYHAGTGRLATMQYDGRTWQYEFDPGPLQHSLLRRVRPPAGLPWEYEYSTSAPGHELTLIRTPHGGTVSYTYGDATHRTAAVTTITRAVMTRTLGGRAVAAGTWEVQYDTGANHDETRVTGPCNVTVYRFLGHGLEGDFSQATAGALAERRLEAGGALLQRETFTYLLSEPISPDFLPGHEGLVSSSGVYNALLAQRVTTRGTSSWTTTLHYPSGLGTFNDYGQPWKIEEHGGAYQVRTTTRTFQAGFAPYIGPRVASASVTERTAFDQFAGPIDSTWTYASSTGFLLSRTIAGVSHTFQARPDGNVHGVTDALGHQTVLDYAWGQVSSLSTPHDTAPIVTEITVNPDGTIAWAGVGGIGTAYTYDSGFRVTSETPTNTATIFYGYDDVTGAFVDVWRAGMPQGAHARVSLDGFGRTVRATTLAGVKSDTAYDACGRVVFASAPYTAGPGTRGTAFTYDPLGRVTSATAPGGATTTYAYDGINVSVTNAEGATTTYYYMSFGTPATERLADVMDPNGTFTRYQYDFGNLKRVEVPGVPARTWQYDQGRLMAETQPESGTTTYSYDAAGRLATVTNAAGELTTLHYFKDSRLKLRDGPGTAGDLALTYDALGRLHTQSAGGVVTTLAYDAAGRLSQKQDQVAGQTFVSQYQYDGHDNLTRIVYPQGRQIDYEYQNQHRLSAVRNNGALFAHGFTYGDGGHLASYVTGAVTHTVELDARDRVRRITAGGALDLTYDYDHVSRVTQIQDPRPGMSQSFAYDLVGRMWAADGPWGALQWTYDAAGNRTSEVLGATTTYNYDAATQRLTGISGASAESFTYDALGRLTSDSRGTYAYNARGLLATATGTNLTASYDYDPSGLRIARTVNDQTTWTIRGAGGQVLSEYVTACGSTVVWARDVVYAGGRPIGAVRATLTPPSVEFVSGTLNVHEHQGPAVLSIRLTTATGTPTTCPATVYYEAVPGTASAGADFTKVAGIVNFPAGTASGATAPITVPIVDDLVHEPTETFSVLLSAVSGVTLGATGGAVVTILDNDPPPALSIDDIVVQEGHSGLTPAVFTVTLSAPASQAVQASYTTVDGTAVAGSDYQAASGSLTIPAGAVSTTLTVMVVGDTLYEADETFTVVLSNVVGATVAKGVGTATILNDDVDSPPRLTWGDIYVPRDGAADAILWRPGTGAWHVRDSASGTFGVVTTLGVSGDIPVPGDYTGDGRTDCAVFRPSTGVWYIAPGCQASATYSVPYGVGPDDIPVPADYDGDGILDLAVYREGYRWWIRQSSTHASLYVEWGLPSSMAQIPHPADYDGDGRADFAVYCVACGGSYVSLSSGGSYGLGWGIAESAVRYVAGDYDGDGVADFVFYDPPTLTWWILPSGTGQGTWVSWGLTTGDIPVPADYDGDGVLDLAVYDPVSRAFYIRGSTVGPIYLPTTSVSLPGDVPALGRPQWPW